MRWLLMFVPRSRVDIALLLLTVMLAAGLTVLYLNRVDSRTPINDPPPTSSSIHTSKA